MLSIKLAKASLKSHRFRSIVATAGVVVGVFMISLSLIISDCIGAGIERQINQFNNKTAIVNGGDALDQFGLTKVPSATLSNDDLRLINNNSAVGYTVATSIIRTDLSTSKRHIDRATLAATTANFQSALGLKVASGNWFDQNDTHKNWLILGHDLAQQLIGTTVARNQIVNIEGEAFTVIGVLARVGQPLSLLGYNVDQAAFMHLQRGQSLFNTTRLSQIIAYPSNKNTAIDQTLFSTLASQHNDKSEYSVMNTTDVTHQLQHTLHVVQCFIFAFAGLSLLISGISIMNIMLVGVVERRREIGIRKAVGATNGNILMQFLMESLITSVNGGILGLILAYLAAYIATFYLSLNLVFSLNAVIFGFILPIAVGIFFGLYPAWRAAKSDVISALRQLT